jgi:hypothetical protein
MCWGRSEVDWERRKLEVVNAFRGEREKRGCQCVGARVHGGEAMPNEGIALRAGGWINRGRKGG